MEQFNTRGYMLTMTLKYVREVLDPKRREAVLAKLSPETIKFAETAKPTEWYPVARSVEIYDAIVDACNGDAALAEQDLIGIGQFGAHEASNTFLRLLMKVLTPGLFAKKLPSLYERDNSKGKVTVEVEDDRLICRIDDCKGCKHLGPISAGWAIYTLETMGKKLSQKKVHGWSLDNPDSGSVSFELIWKA